MRATASFSLRNQVSGTVHLNVRAAVSLLGEFMEARFPATRRHTKAFYARESHCVPLLNPEFSSEGLQSRQTLNFSTCALFRIETILTALARLADPRFGLKDVP